MPRFDPRNPRNPKRNTASEFINSAEEANVPMQKQSSFAALTEIFTKQHKKSHSFPEVILAKLAPIWETAIEPVLIREFGRRSTLYIIFYQGKYHDEIIMEIWDPKYVDQKESQVFSLEGVPSSTARHFPKNREDAEIGVLQDWD